MKKLLPFALLALVFGGCDAIRLSDSQGATATGETQSAPQSTTASSEPAPPTWASIVEKDGFGTYADLKVGNLTQRFRWCPPGSFGMSGSLPGLGTAIPPKMIGTRHRVTLTKGFWLADSEVTQALYLAIAGTAAGSKQGANMPVDQISAQDADAFCVRMNSVVKGNNARLPTEAEWEYACRGGGSKEQSGQTETFAWFRLNSNKSYHPVKQLTASAWGLYDMHGNVFEFCSDYKADFTEASVTDPKGPKDGKYRVAKGGGAMSGEKDVMAIQRYGYPPDSRGMLVGFRIVIE